MKIGSKEITKVLIDFFEIVFIASGVFIFVYFFVAQLLKITGDSMLPTFKDGEQIIAEKVSIKFSPLKRGDIVIFKHPQNENRLLIKRVVGLPGELIRISQGNLYINSEKLEESYIQPNNKTTEEKDIKENTDYKIPDGSYIVLGDNREFSSDSREFGPIKEGLIVGRAFAVYYPLSNFRLIEK